MIGDEATPYQVVWMQECRSMNILLSEMQHSLSELELGFRGDLTMSDSMEKLLISLYENKVPGSWKDISYPSMRGLGSWAADLQLRVKQLNEVVHKNLAIPNSTWISGLFNPQRFLKLITLKFS